MPRNSRVALAAALLVALGSLPLTSHVATAADSPKSPQRWAVLIGVDQYTNVHKLKYCVADQQALAKQLVASGFPEDQVFVLSDKAQETRFSALQIEYRFPARPGAGHGP